MGAAFGVMALGALFVAIVLALTGAALGIHALPLGRGARMSEPIKREWITLKKILAEGIRVSRRHGRTILLSTGAGAALIGSLMMLWRGPWWLDGAYLSDKGLREGSAALVTGFRTALVQTLAALGASLALVYTARNFRLTRRGQVTERFTKALERLGSDEIYVRIGGVLALEQIVQDAPEQATHAAQVLYAFTRERAPRVGRHDTTTAVRAARRKARNKRPSVDASPRPSSSPSADVQAALTALTRPASRRHVDSRLQIDLSGFHLAGVQLNGADMRGINLSGADLEDADLSECLLAGVNMEGSNLRDASLEDADLENVNLRMADLTRANLMRANLRFAKIEKAKLCKAELMSAQLQEAQAFAADLTEASLRLADLTHASFHDANFTQAFLHSANLTNTFLHAAYLADSTVKVHQIATAWPTDATILPQGFSSDLSVIPRIEAATEVVRQGHL
ncbi:pentapeptide repeat-containing protein [Streptomyces sp. NPDC088731]|uniref:pentapeptide repeat-containing protein n=1 Tax=Streptomyces sp. NPDC088731 TaxID=3365878 RepID=UPI003824BD50